MARQRAKQTGSLFKRTPGGCWIARWTDGDGGRPERSTYTTDKQTAERVLSKYIGDAALRKSGIIDAATDRHAAANRRPIGQHVDDWIDALAAKGVTKQHRDTLRTRVQALIDATKVERIANLSASAVQTAIGELHRDTGDEPGIALQTCQHYLRAVKQFSRWLHRDGRTKADALAHLTGYNAATDKRYERRALDADELAVLIDGTETAPAWRGLSGPDRAMLYRVAAGTGFRAGELASLTPASFKLDDAPPAVILKAKSSKRRREDRQPIRVDLADTLADWLKGREPDAPLWPGLWYRKAATMIRRDRRLARVRWLQELPRGTARKKRRERLRDGFLALVDDAGRVLDFHALRVSFITLLVKGGASVKVAQALARHSDPALTLNTYTALGIHDLAGALDILPAVGKAEDKPAVERAPVRKTGTDDAPVKIDPRPQPRQLQGNRRQPVAAVGSEREKCHEPDTSRKACKSRGFGSGGQKVSEHGTNAPGAIRTHDLRFRKPVLYPAELRARRCGCSQPVESRQTLGRGAAVSPSIGRAWRVAYNPHCESSRRRPGVMVMARTEAAYVESGQEFRPKSL